ncbi:hypothetical protein C6I21_03720 [Alkalicoccus urumqiensis]|uniref:Uncharacterized protein n=1 Tax=Alkalicoccus urumqiensis TaxID=1548213 RepID=A0A2P6MJJ5_ALKUR|nr:hypothetical protein C6I21_03720 [Alkalicoccus urumqiensis]
MAFFLSSYVTKAPLYTAEEINQKRPLWIGSGSKRAVSALSGGWLGFFSILPKPQKPVDGEQRKG